MGAVLGRYNARRDAMNHDARAARLEELIARGLEELQQRESEARKVKKEELAARKRQRLAGASSSSAPVSSEGADYLDAANKRAKEVARSAFAQMATRPLVESTCQVDLPGGRTYDMPYLYADVLVEKETLYAFGKSYVSKDVLPNLDERRKQVQEVASQGRPFALGDAHGRMSAVVVPHAFTPAARRGRRALVALMLLQGGGGYMACCQGSGNVESQRTSSSLRHAERLAQYGKPQAAKVVGVETTRDGSAGSAKLVYGTPDEEGRVVGAKKWQFGAWLWRQEYVVGGQRASSSSTKVPELIQAMEAAGLGDYVDDVSAYLHEVDAIQQQYNPLLLVEGEDAVLPEDLPEGALPSLLNRLTLNIADSAGHSKFGVHRDTPQLPGCVTSVESVFPAGFHPVDNYELILTNGLLPISYCTGRDPNLADAAVVLAGHRTWHTVPPIRISPTETHRNVTHLRFSAVSWTNGGEHYPNLVDALRASTSADEYRPTAEVQGKLLQLRTIARTLLGSSDRPPDFGREQYILKPPRRTAFVDGTPTTIRTSHPSMLGFVKPPRKASQ
jgi:hypothetical protein